jgi:hypothetical protein
MIYWNQIIERGLIITLHNMYQLWNLEKKKYGENLIPKHYCPGEGDVE